MIELRRPFGKLAVILFALYSLAHLLAAAGLIAFGVSADGYPLNRWGIYSYAAAALVALVLSLSELRRREEGPSPLQLTLPPLLALWVAGLYFTTAVLWAEFAPWLDDDGLFAALNLGFALAGCGLALGYRWPRLLTIWAGGQGLLLLTNPGLLSTTLRYGARWDPEGLPLLLLPLAYGLSGLALGYHVRLRRLLRWLVPFALAGAMAGAIPLHRLLSEVYRPAGMGPAEMGLLVALHGLSTIYVVALVLGLPFHAWRASRTWPTTSRDRAAGGWVWPAFLALVYIASRLVQGLLEVGQALPAPGEVPAWVSQSHVVPDAYPEFMYWVPTLLAALRWLLLPLALTAAWQVWRAGVKVRWPARQFPALLAWPALASLAAFLTLIPPLGLGFVLMTVWEGGRAGVGLMFMPLVAGLGLLGLARLMEGLTRVWAKALAGLATLALLIGYLWRQGRALAAYARVLFAPLPIWAERWKYAPFDPKLAAAAGLVVHSGVLVLGLWALWRTWRALAQPGSAYAVPGRVWLRVGLGVAVMALSLVGFWYWWTDPGVMETIPPQGAMDVPRDTVIVVRFGPESPLREFWSSGQGMSVHYADTGEHIPGATAGSARGISYNPEGLLRPNAAVQFTVHRRGRRPFVLRFTTAGADSPRATPLPRTFGPTPAPPPPFTPTPAPTPGPTPTPEPTSDLRPRSSTYGDVEIRMVANPQDSSKTDVCVENLATGEEVLRVTLSDIHISHYHNSEYHNGNLYIIRRIGYVPEQWDSEEWTDELWGYNADGEGMKLYSAQGLDFRVAPDERHIALRISDLKCTWDKLIFLDSSGNSVREFAADQFIGHPDKEAYAPLPTHLFLLEWSDDSSEFWGHVSAGPMPITFYKIKVDLWQITTYEVSKLNIPCEYDLNVNAGKLVYSDCPQIYDVYGREEFEKSQHQVTLFVYDFSNRSTQTIATAVAKCFNPKWLDDSTIEYNNPDGDDRIVYTMPSLSNLAYIQDGDVWVKTLPDGEPQRLTTDSRNTEPHWSPSGDWLAFRKFKQVWVMRADGSDARSMMAVPDGAFAWSPIADRLAYADGDRLKVVNADGTDPATLVAGPSVTPPTPPPLKENTVGRIAWSPDGAWIAFGWQEWQPGQPLTYQGLWRVSSDGEQLAELYVSGAPEKGEAILAGWSLDGQHIIFWQGEMLSGSMLADGVPLYSLPAGGGEPVQLARELASDARPSTDKVLAHSDFVAPAPASAQVAVTVGAYRATWMNKRVAVVEAGTDAISVLTTEDLAAFSPSWSPDSTRLAYVAVPDEGDLVGGNDARLGMMERRIWVLNVQGEPQLQQLTDDPAYRDERPLWSADGSHLLFARMDAEGGASLWLIPAVGGEPRRVVNELTPLPGPAVGWFGYYGHVEWDQLFDWWRGPVRAPEGIAAPTPGPLPTARPPVSPTPTPSPPTPTPTTVLTATRTYTDNAHGFAIDYPADWDVDGVQGALLWLSNPATSGEDRQAINIAALAEPSLEAMLDNVERSSFGRYMIMAESVQLGGLEALKVTVRQAPEDLSLLWLVITPQSQQQGQGLIIVAYGDAALAEAILATWRPVP